MQHYVYIEDTAKQSVFYRDFNGRNAAARKGTEQAWKSWVEVEETRKRVDFHCRVGMGVDLAGFTCIYVRTAYVNVKSWRSLNFFGLGKPFTYRLLNKNLKKCHFSELGRLLNKKKTNSHSDFKLSVVSLTPLLSKRDSWEKGVSF